MTVEVVTIGRVNIDIIMNVDKLPSRGQHILADNGQVAFGGSAANFAVQSALLGVKTGLVACIGNDPYGQFVQKHLTDMEVDISRVEILRNQTTGLFFIVNDSEDCEMIIADPGANRFLDRLDEKVFEDDYLSRVRIIHVAGGFPNITATALDIATSNGMIFSFDPGRAADNLDFSKILPRTDLLFVNQHELKTYFKINPSERALRNFAKTIPGIVVLKQGKKGAIATDGFEYHVSDIFEVSVTDTLGAGDSFAAGFVTAWTRSENIEQALHFANAVAALTITKKGAQVGQPSLNEVASLMKKYGMSIEPILRTFRARKRRK